VKDRLAFPQIVAHAADIARNENRFVYPFHGVTKPYEGGTVRTVKVELSHAGTKAEDGAPQPRGVIFVTPFVLYLHDFG
jgi:hypothetical protein